MAVQPANAAAAAQRRMMLVIAAIIVFALVALLAFLVDEATVSLRDLLGVIAIGLVISEAARL